MADESAAGYTACNCAHKGERETDRSVTVQRENRGNSGAEHSGIASASCSAHSGLTWRAPVGLSATVTRDRAGPARSALTQIAVELVLSLFRSTLLTLTILLQPPQQLTATRWQNARCSRSAPAPR